MKLGSAILFFCLASLLQAEDVVTMVNGRKITGVISLETSDKVMIEMQGLKLSLHPREISHIERMDTEARKQALKKVRSPRPHEEEFYPKNARPLFRALVELDDYKLRWNEAADKAQVLESQKKATQGEISRLDRIIEVGKKQLDNFELPEDLSPLERNRKIEVYNIQVNQTNLFVEQIRRAISFDQQLERDIEASYKKVNEHRKTYAGKAQRVGKNWLLFSNALPDEPAPDWFGELYQRINHHPVAFELMIEIDLPAFILNEMGQREYTLAKDPSGHYFVTVELNQIQIVDFLIDTGATISLLPESVGKAAGARVVGLPVKTQVADGRTVKVIPAVLDEIDIYGQRFKNVAVGLMPDKGPYKIPNLLGMNIISQIPIRLSPEGLVMTLEVDE